MDRSYSSARGWDTGLPSKLKRRWHSLGYGLYRSTTDAGRILASFGSWAELAPGVPLAQEIPALIELDFGFFQPHLIVICQPVLLVKMLLLMHEAFDLPED
jgi:hypothetical protein